MSKLKQNAKLWVGVILTIAVLLTGVFAGKYLKQSSIAANEAKPKIEANLEKYVNYNIPEGEQGTLVQYTVRTGVEYGSGQSYLPVKRSDIEVALNQIDQKYPKQVKVIAKSTQATNGNKQDVAYAYDDSTGKLTFTASNQNEKGEAIYTEGNKAENDEYILLCYYDTFAEDNPEREVAFDISAKVSLFAEDTTEITREGKFAVTVTENVSELTSIDYSTDEIYNGYIKSNIINNTEYVTGYKETAKITVSKKQSEQKIELQENTAFGNKFDLVYKSTKISQKELQKLLGEDGILQIIDVEGNVLADINKDTEFGEDGTFTINYENDVDTLIVKTSDVQTEGILQLENKKQIKPTMRDIDNNKIKVTSILKGLREVKSEIISENSNNENQQRNQTQEIFAQKSEKEIEVKDATTKVGLRLNNNKWTNEQQNKVTFNVVLDSRSFKDNMFKNPTVRIDLPEEVEKIMLESSSIAYANGLVLKDAHIEQNQNGTFSIVATVEGVQTTYAENNLNITTDIVMDATVILKKDIENAEKDINVYYTNEYTVNGRVEEGLTQTKVNLESYEGEKEPTVADQVEELKKVAQPNQIAELKAAVESMTNEQSGLQVKVIPTRGDAVVKEGDIIYEGEYIKYSIEITNTTEETIDDVKIIGNIPEGTIYAELEADYYNALGKYEYTVGGLLERKEIEVGRIEPGKTYNTFYEVTVANIADFLEEKETSSAVSVYKGEELAATIVTNNKIKQSETRAFLGLFLDNAKDRWNYKLNLFNRTSINTEDARPSESKEVKVKLTLPEEYDFDYILHMREGEAFGEYVYNVYTGDTDKVTKLSDNTIELTLNTNDGEYWIEGKVDSSKIKKNKEDSKVELKAYATIDDKYKANEARMLYSYENATITVTSDNEGEEVEYGHEINYKINVKNIGRTNLSDPNLNQISVNVVDFLPENVKPISLRYENYRNIAKEGEDAVFEKEEITGNLNTLISNDSGNKLADVDLLLTIPYGESVDIYVVTTAEYVHERTTVENSATIVGNNIDPKTSNTVQHTILPVIEDQGNSGESDSDADNLDGYEDQDYSQERNNESQGNGQSGQNNQGEQSDGAQENGQNSSGDASGSNYSQNITNNTDVVNENNKYSIQGLAWLDENQDGARNTSEKTLTGMTVMLVDLNNSSEVKAKTTTSANGYSFSDLQSGEYIVVFQYDTDKYGLTEYRKSGVSNALNSDAMDQEITLQGNKVKVGVTDVIKLTGNASSVDVGLVEAKRHDFKLDKYITKITTETAKGTKTKSYKNKKLAKAEIRAKEIEGAKITVEYKIVVTNEGETEAIPGSVIDYLPDGLEFDKKLNNDWTLDSSKNLINTSISGSAIQPGSSRDITLVLTKQVTAETTGTFTNAAEIGGLNNQVGIKDVDSTPGNKNETEDDYSKADLIVSVSTGTFLYITIAIAGVAILTIVGLFTYRFGIAKLGKVSMFVLLLSTIAFVQTGTTNGDYEAINTYKYVGYIGGPHYNAYGGICFEVAGEGHGHCMAAGAPAATGNYRCYATEVISSNLKNEIASSNISLDATNRTGNKTMIETSDKKYYIIGPFQYRYKGFNNSNKLKLEVRDGYDREIEQVRTCDENGNNKDLIPATNSEKTDEFYLKVTKTLTGMNNCKYNQLESGISRVKIYTEQTINTTKEIEEYGHKYYSIGGAYQPVRTCSGNLLLRTYSVSGTAKAELYAEWVNNINCELNIMKYDADDANKKLQGVKFILRDTSTGEFIRDGENVKDHVNTTKDIKKSKVWTTDKEGKVAIENLKYDKTYEIYEVYNPNKEYNLDPEKKDNQYQYGIDGYDYRQFNRDGAEIKNIRWTEENKTWNYADKNQWSDTPILLCLQSIIARSGVAYEWSALNRNNTGELQIKKLDYDAYNSNPRKEVPIPGVQFKIRSGDNKWIRVNNQDKVTGDVDIADINKDITEATEKNATIFETDNNGLIKINNITTGKYTVKEVSLGSNKDYDLDAKNTAWKKGENDQLDEGKLETEVEVKRKVQKSNTASGAIPNGTYEIQSVISGNSYITAEYPEDAYDEYGILKADAEPIRKWQKDLTAMVLDVQYANPHSGTDVKVYERNSTAAQKFYVEYVPTKKAYVIRNLVSNKVLDVAGGAGGVRKNTYDEYEGNVQVWTQNYTDAQYWKIENKPFKNNKNETVEGFKIASLINMGGSNGRLTLDKRARKIQHWKY